MLVDTHLHLDFEHFDEDRADVVAHAVESGVTRMITIGTSLETSHRAIELAETFEQVWAAIGIHPNDASEWGWDAAATMREWAAHPRVVAIGEIGLDYYWERVPHDIQQRAFEEQLALAGELKLPVIVHDREAHEDIMATLRRWVSTLTDQDRRGVLHFFSGDRAMAEEALELGFYIGADGPITYKNARELQEVIAAIPLDRLLVETDAPFLSPHPHRGKRNEPAFVRHVADQVGWLHAVSYEEVAARTTRNAFDLFELELNS